MPRAIFISYRRDDSEGEAGRLFDDLVRAFGDDSVFMDVAGINPGTDFRKAIDSNVATCGVLLAVIGPRWLDVTDRSGHPRLQDENDFVRLETASALSRNIPVIPVLVHDAKMPGPDQLPDNLKDLAYRNSVEITHARWNSDVALLTKALSDYVGSSKASDTEPVHATVPVQLPPPVAPPSEPAPTGGSKTALFGGVALGALVLIALVAFFAFHRSSPRDSSPNQTNAVAGAQPGDGSPLVGSWANQAQAAGNELARLQITSSGDRTMLHGWGACPGCDWGTQTASLNGPQATAVFRFAAPMANEAAGRVATVTVVRHGPLLDVRVLNTFTARPPADRRSVFVRAQ